MHLKRIIGALLALACCGALAYRSGFHSGYEWCRRNQAPTFVPRISRDSAVRAVIAFLERQIVEKNLDSLPIKGEDDPPADGKYVLVRYALDAHEVAYRVWRWELQDPRILQFLDRLGITIAFGDRVTEAIEYDPAEDEWSVWIKIYRDDDVVKKYEVIAARDVARAKGLDKSFVARIPLMID